MIGKLSYFPPLDNSDHICIQFDLLCYSAHKKAAWYNTRAILDPLDAIDTWLLFESIFQDTIDRCVPILITIANKRKERSVM